MSVTFSVPLAPTTTSFVPCDYGKGEAWACRAEERCGYCADGVERVVTSEAGDLNVANVTARILLDLLAIHSPDLMGTLIPANIPDARRRIMRALNTSRPEREALPATAGGGPGTGRCAWFGGGINSVRIRAHLAHLDVMLAYAQTRGFDVVWG